MKLLRFARMLLTYGLCLTVAAGVFFHNTALASGYEEVLESIASYVVENRDALIEDMNTVESWSEEYYLLYKEADWVKGHEVEYPYNREFVLDDDVNLFFCRE